MKKGKETKTSVGRKNETIESRWVDVGDQLIHYRASVNPSNNNLPPIILIHGLGVSSRYMIPTARKLAAHRTIYAPDLPGFGRSGKPARPLNITELSDALARWMELLVIDRAVLLANSIGCQIVVDLALRRPELVERLVLTAPTVDSEARTVFRSFLRLLLDVPRERLSLAFIALLDYLQAGLGRTAQTFGYAIQDKIEERLPGVRHPVLVVRGQYDPVVPERWAEEVNRLVPSSQLVVIKGAAHAVNHNSPEQLAQCVLGFLKSEE
ncbi:MAG: alpha/beta hydrolase [Acidobacteria bacterium]|nr:alpha/beta hydrolase [Acidobacteriota bacterium]